MNVKRWRWVLAVVGLLLAGIGAYFALRLREEPVSPTESVPVVWSEARLSPMHALHVGKNALPCAGCHAGGFERPPGESVCAGCHAKPSRRPHLATTSDGGARCLTCHVFGAKPPAPTCTDCHVAGRDPRAKKIAHHADPSIACTACHDPHGEERGRLADCTGCHEGASASHGRIATRPSGAAPHAVDDAGEGGAAAAALQFAKELYASSAGAEPSATGDPSTGQICTTCHAPHAGKSTARDTCAACHASAGRGEVDGRTFGALAPPRVTPQGPKVAGHDACVTCHDPHVAEKNLVRACQGCHEAQRSALSNPMHATSGCPTCHAPHAPTTALASCQSCHAGKNVLASARVPAHGACNACHDPHDPKAPPQLACAKCHESIRPSHPTSASGACVGCHDPHPSGPTQPIAAACSSCHTKASSETAFHARKVTCAQCHTPHQFALVNTKGQAGATFCAQCHAPEKAKTNARAGHQDCRACHGEPHTPVKQPTCQGCHGAEVATAPKGHARCTSCHDAHDGSLGNRAICTTCHTNKKQALHASVLGADGKACTTCHRPHGPKEPATPPKCTTCHDVAKLPGLHRKPMHVADCRSCHTSHAPPRADRATCTGSCHQDRRNHQPDADLCAGCHVFRR